MVIANFGKNKLKFEFFRYLRGLNFRKLEIFGDSLQSSEPIELC